MEFLEDFRGDGLNKAALALSTAPPLFNYTSFNEYSILAYRFMIQNLIDLENSEETLNYGLQCVPAINMWYTSMNSFVNVILKTACLRTGHNYLKAYSQPIDLRYAFIINLLDIKTEENQHSNLIGKLKDFEQFVNSIGFDIFENDKKIYEFTEFSSLPSFLNQIDVLQAYIIAYEVFEAFRFLISGLDLMPNITLTTESKKVVFEKLDVIMKKVLIPSVKDIFSKQKLKTKLSLSQKFISYPSSRLFQKRQVIAIFKYQSDDVYKFSVNKTRTNIIGAFHSTLIKKYAGNEEKYNLNFMTSDFKS